MKTKTHTALALVDCTIFWEFESPADAGPGEMEEDAWEQYPGASLCHQCADTLYVGDALRITEVDGEELDALRCEHIAAEEEEAKEAAVRRKPLHPLQWV